MNSRLFTLPNLLTCTNIVCGALAIVAVCNRNIETACVLVVISLVADFLDGFTARALKIHSEIGKELDSLADVVTFGVLPGIVMFYLIGEAELGVGASIKDFPLKAYSSFLIVAFSALRLAKFNLDTRQSDSFLGLATPANTIFIFSLWLSFHFHPTASLTQIITHPYMLCGLVVGLCFMLISEIPLLAFKFKTWGWQSNRWKYLTLIVSIICIVLGGWQGLVGVIPAYILLSLLSNFSKQTS
jgi:CDP-diacylglycerol--serine O-phosphatidyltransferase